MSAYLEIFWNKLLEYPVFLFKEIGNVHPGNFLYWLTGISLFFFLAEAFFPWRREQRHPREDFYLDAFYMYFNMFLVPMAGVFAFSHAFEAAFRDLLGAFGIVRLDALSVRSWPGWAQLLFLFIARDFIHWNVHRLLHRVPFLWEFHKVHHSVRRMGFAAHLRYHWTENIFYRALEYIPLSLIGFGITDFFLAYVIGLGIGHFNHSNVKLPLGPLRYVFNNPQMHIWHHARSLPPEKRYGVNFGLSLSLWDYLFRTAYLPRDGRDETLGFPGDERFPRGFFGQIVHGFRISPGK